MTVSPRSFFYSLVLFLILSSRVSAVGLGINKVRYHADPHWQVIETQHFDIHYAPSLERVAHQAALYAERAFRNTSRFLDFVPQKRIPLFIYGTGLEFQETNITTGYLPEGVGGFTEVFKNRIVVPMTGSYYDLEEVIRHELTHAFQYDLIYGEGWRSLNLFRSIFIPNWMMEGMAEYMAQHVESQGEMVLRDAVLNNGTMPLHLMASFDHFEQVYMAYKESESILDYVSQVYGPSKVADLMKKMSSSQGGSSPVSAILGVDEDQLYENWHFFLQTQTWSRVAGRPDPGHYGTSAVKGAGKACWSPDGKRLAFLDEDGIGLYEPARKKKTHFCGGSFESQGSGIAWSPDNRYIAAFKKQCGTYHLLLVPAPGSSAPKRFITFPNLPLLVSPAWSPDGKYLVFSGFDYGTSDLYRWDLETNRLTRLTNDDDTDSCPLVAPDGGAIYYISESQGETHLKRLILDPLGNPVGSPKKIQFQVGQSADTVPEGHLAFIAAGKGGLYLASNRDHRIFNLFRVGWDGKGLVQLTRSFVDILSAVPSPDGDTLYAGIYQKFAVDLWCLESSHLESIPTPPSELSYLSNSFSGASTLLAQNTRPTPTPDFDDDSMSVPPPLPRGYSMGISDELNDARRRPLRKLDLPKPTHPPSAPTRLTVKEATNLVHLQWVDSEKEQEADQYKIYRSASAQGPFKCIGSTDVNKRLRYVDYEIENDKIYYYYVTALNEIGESIPSETVQASPKFTQCTKPYRFRISPDILLLLAGYDSAYGFMGGAALSMSDYLGNNRISFMGERVPGNQTGLQLDYEYAKYRTTLNLNLYYYNDFYNLLDINTGNILNQYRDKDKGANLMFTYPLSVFTRFEYGIGTERFQGMPSTLRFSEGISNHFLSPSNGQDNANFYRLSLVMDKRRGRRFWVNAGWGGSLTYLQAPSLLDSTVSFRNYLVEGEWYVDFKPLQHLVWANRIVGFHSEGPQPQTYFLGPDRPFQAFFTTFRGFGSADYFGRNLMLYNVELRLPMVTDLNSPLRPFNFFLLKDIELAIFSDTGIVADQMSGFSTHRLLNSIGTGLRFYNFVFQRSLVQLRFDVAWRTDPGHHPPVFTFNLVPSF